jgi:hypothetical protein
MEGTPNRKPIPMSERLGMFPEAWKPKEGDQLIGTITELSDRDGGFGDYPVVTVLTEAGDEYAVHGYRVIVDRKTPAPTAEPDCARRTAEAQAGLGEDIPPPDEETLSDEEAW